MNEVDRRKRNEERLKELYPTFRARLKLVITSLGSDGIRPRIQDTWRSPADQKKAYDSGNSNLLFGSHNVTAQNGIPQSLTVDLLDDDSPLDAGKSYRLQLAAAAERAGHITGIRWSLPNKLRTAIDQSVAAKNWKANVKIGWDPTHVQPTDLTVAEARAGKRPA